MPTLPDLLADPEIAPLLEFQPVARKVKRPDGWTAERQRAFVAWLAWFGSPSAAARQMGKNVSGIEAIYREAGADSFRAAWDAALEIGWQRDARRQEGERFAGRAPGMTVRGAKHAEQSPLPGQVRNEHGEWEDEQSLAERAEEARDSIGNKLVRVRRLYLQEISSCPGKRAAFEILTELPVDWAKAEAGEPQEFEPWTKTNQRQPDQVLVAESGWSFGELGYGPNRMAAARKAIDDYRAERGEPPVDWSAEAKTNDGVADALA